MPTALTAQEVLTELMEGNARFARGEALHPHATHGRIIELAQTQEPMAVVLACADSRAPVEIVLECGLGDLLVARIAGNTFSPGVLGTIEFGIVHLGTPLVLVLGHTNCGAVTAATYRTPVEGSVKELISHIEPAVTRAWTKNPALKGEAMVESVVHENVWHTIHELFRRGQALRQAAREGRVEVHGAVYEVATGVVEWMGRHPEESRFLL